MENRDISCRANHALHLFLIVFLLILIRIWYLSVLKHDVFREKATAPRKKVLIEQPARGVIRDRFNFPLAINTMQYNAAICYDKIRDIPLVVLEKNSKGEKIFLHKRRLYIASLSKMMACHLDMDPTVIEDLIYAQASMLPHAPFIIRKGISEKTYYTLRALEKNWVGLETQRSMKRFYPQKKEGSNIIGYMGAIHASELHSIGRETKTLQDFFKQWTEKLPVPLPKGFNRINEVESRLDQLKEKAYTAQTRVGKMGVERVFDEGLRGFFGKTQVEVGANGRIIARAPEQSEPVAGHSLTLTISAELQAFAESLLIQSEHERQELFAHTGRHQNRIAPPWIMGGAIVAMIPQTGEVVALASCPRFDPNDFTEQNNQRIHQWMETPHHMANIWDGKIGVMKERYSPELGRPHEQNEMLCWDTFLDHILSLDGQVRKTMQKVGSIQKAAHLLNVIYTLMKIGKTDQPHFILQALYHERETHIPSCYTKIDVEKIQAVRDRLSHSMAAWAKNELDFYFNDIKHHDDKLLLLDLLRLALDPSLFHESLLQIVGKDSLSTYRSLCQAHAIVEDEIKKQVRITHHEHIFPIWRKEKFPSYLKEKRGEEKMKKTYPHPYTNYLMQAKVTLFEKFWNTHKWDFLETLLFKNPPANPEVKSLAFHLLTEHQKWENALFLKQLNKLRNRLENLPRSEAINYLKSMRAYADLTHVLWGHYSLSPPLSKQATLQDLALSFYPKNGLGFHRSYAYGCATTLGSLFKPVVGYEALKQEYLKKQQKGVLAINLNPLTIYDECHPQTKVGPQTVLGRTVNGQPILRQYKGGRLPKSHTWIGEVDFSKAMQRSSNLYFSLLASDVLDDPSSLYRTTKELGFGSLTNIDLTGEIPGLVPDDIQDDRTGLYSFAIGQHSLVVTPLQTSVMLSALANGGEVLKPQIINFRTSMSSMRNLKPRTFYAQRGYRDQITDVRKISAHLIKRHQSSNQHMTTASFKKEICRTLFMPKQVQDMLLDSLYHVVWDKNGPGHPCRIKALLKNPQLAREYRSLEDQFIGKTSTAEFAYRPTLDKEIKPIICKDIWFGAISFDQKLSQSLPYHQATPELVVVVYLRFGDYGKEAAPLAAQVIKKWRDIKGQP